MTIAFSRLAAVAVTALIALPIAWSAALAQAAASARQSMSDAWWTGPMLANSASTLPRGHVLVEPYFYDVSTVGAFGTNGDHHSTPRAHGYGSLAYIIVGVTDRLSAGFVPTIGYNTIENAPSSSRLQLGDVSLLAQYGLTRFHEGSPVPSIALSFKETFPTGKYDRLGERAADGSGSGAYTSTVAIHSQTYLWLPNGRILRVRLNGSQAFSSRATVSDESVYGTDGGFRGTAAPGSATLLDLAVEYSLTKRWVLASDVTYQHARNTTVTGTSPSQSRVAFGSGSSDVINVAPAVEYNLNSNVGVLFGVRIVAAGWNTSSTITPAIAINVVH
ncbi:MAG TPA: hypothetical protein VH559_00805 [Gemmatimonadaceae bacterium]|jgi:hypothetical protein